MERLTDNKNYCEYWSDCEMAEGKCVFNANCYDRKIYNKLREYEDLEEQGLLLKLPCKVGDMVYSVECDRIEEFVVTQFDVFTENIYAISNSIFVGLMGYSVFATREEAEKALEEMEK